MNGSGQVTMAKWRIGVEGAENDVERLQVASLVHIHLDRLLPSLAIRRLAVLSASS